MDIYLDFDGVICDSFEECCVSSGLAWSGKSVGSEGLELPHWTDQYLADFRSSRPFIRSGEDYVVLHEALSQGSRPRTQQEFDDLLNKTGPDKLAEFKNRLYQIREALIVHHKGLWMSWNPLYPGFEELLKKLSHHTRTYILSTKKAEFIQQILAYNDISWPRQRIFYTAGKKKMEIIDLHSGFEPSVLIDDQVDHLDFEHPHCDCRLALWGFIKPEWLKPQLPAFSLEQALSFLWGFA